MRTPSILAAMGRDRIILIVHPLDAYAMIIIQVAGFLGSGKTTLMIRLGKALAEQGRRAVIIVNEVGEVGVDGDLLASQGLQALELTEGCICCSLSGTLQNTLRMVKTELSPDFVLIEPTGLALPGRINGIIRTSLVEPERVVTVALVDAFRAEDLARETRAFFLRQMESADLVALNKVDLVQGEALDRAEALVRELCPDARVVRLSARTGEGMNELAELMGLP